MTPLNILISLHRGYGLGDAVQMSAVLRHVVAARPNWRISYQAEDSKHQVAQDIATNHFAYGAPYPTPHFDAEVQILLYDTWYGWTDRPNTRVSSCLHERFGLGWDAACGRYRVDVSPGAADKAGVLVAPSHEVRKLRDSKPRTVAVHYQGDSAPAKKNLTYQQAEAVCKVVEQLGCNVLLLDWRNASPLTDRLNVRTTGRMPQSLEWGADAEMNCAVVAQCDAFVGIDSGPAKCASATDTPALVVWTGHHPAPFHDPAPNTTHLVPVGYHGLEPVCGNPGVIAWFEAHYNVRQYEDDPVGEVKRWLGEVLK